MFNWFNKRKNKQSKNATTYIEDKGLHLSYSPLPTESSLSNSNLTPIKDPIIIGRLITLAPEIGNLILYSSIKKDLKKVKPNETIYKAILEDGAELFDSKNTTGTKRGGYLNSNKELRQAEFKPVNDEIDGSIKKVNGKQVTSSIFNVASLIVGQYYISQISSKLNKISDNINKIEQFQENEYVSKITTLLKEVKKLNTFQFSTLTDKELCKEKILLLTDLEKECSQLLDQAIITINNLLSKKPIDFKSYEETTLQIEKWRKYQLVLLDILHQISLLGQIFSAKKHSHEESFCIFNQCLEQCKLTFEKLKSFHSDQQEKFKINISTKTISNGLIAKGVASVVGIFAEEVKDKIERRNLPQKTAEIIIAQMTPLDYATQKEPFPFNEPVELIIKDGEIYYLPKLKN